MTDELEGVDNPDERHRRKVAAIIKGVESVLSEFRAGRVYGEVGLKVSIQDGVIQNHRILTEEMRK